MSKKNSKVVTLNISKRVVNETLGFIEVSESCPNEVKTLVAVSNLLHIIKHKPDLDLKCPNEKASKLANTISTANHLSDAYVDAVTTLFYLQREQERVVLEQFLHAVRTEKNEASSNLSEDKVSKLSSTLNAMESPEEHSI